MYFDIFHRKLQIFCLSNLENRRNVISYCSRIRDHRIFTRCMGSDGYDQELVWLLSAHLVTDPLSQSRYVHPNGMPDILVKKSPC